MLYLPSNSSRTSSHGLPWTPRKRISASQEGQLFPQIQQIPQYLWIWRWKSEWRKLTPQTQRIPLWLNPPAYKPTLFAPYPSFALSLHWWYAYQTQTQRNFLALHILAPQRRPSHYHTEHRLPCPLLFLRMKLPPIQSMVRQQWWYSITTRLKNPIHRLHPRQHATWWILRLPMGLL